MTIYRGKLTNECLIFLPRAYPGWDTMFDKGYYEYLEMFFYFTFYGKLLVLPEILEDSFFECPFSIILSFSEISQCVSEMKFWCLYNKTSSFSYWQSSCLILFFKTFLQLKADRNWLQTHRRSQWTGYGSPCSKLEANYFSIFTGGSEFSGNLKSWKPDLSEIWSK